MTLAIVVIVLLFADRAWSEHLRFLERQHAQPDTPNLRPLLKALENANQRIQAPEVAVATHAAREYPTEAPRAISPDDDQAHWDAMGFDQDELAKLAWEQEQREREEALSGTVAE